MKVHDYNTRETVGHGCTMGVRIMEVHIANNWKLQLRGSEAWLNDFDPHSIPIEKVKKALKSIEEYISEGE